jgi:hypothetical protein
LPINVNSIKETAKNTSTASLQEGSEASGEKRYNHYETRASVLFEQKNKKPCKKLHGNIFVSKKH